MLSCTQPCFRPLMFNSTDKDQRWDRSAAPRLPCCENAQFAPAINSQHCLRPYHHENGVNYKGQVFTIYAILVLHWKELLKELSLYWAILRSCKGVSSSCGCLFLIRKFERHASRSASYKTRLLMLLLLLRAACFGHLG